MKAISLWQPWASLWLSPNKIHETRHWYTPHRGRLLVHAAKRFIKDVDSDLDDILTSEFGGHWGMDLPTGALIGMVDLISCVPTDWIYAGRDQLSEAENIDATCGDFSPERYGWRRGAYWVFQEPIAYRGMQAIFNVPDGIVAAAITVAKECAP